MGRFLKYFYSPSSGVFLFVLFLAYINGASWAFADSYDHYSNVDVQTYTGLFEFDWDQHPVRRYRVIVPMLAAGVHFVFGSIFSVLSPNDFPGDFPTIFSFLIVNNLLMALFAVLVFRLCSFVLGNKYFWPAMLGVASVLTCRWTLYISGSALVDSLYLVTVAILLLGILRKESWLVILAIYLGPWAKEAFIFFVPLLVFTDKTKWLLWFKHLVVSGVIIFSFRYFFDQYIGADFSQSISRDVSHFKGMGASLSRLFSFHGLYEVLSIGGVWNVFIIGGLLIKEVRQVVLENVKPMWWLFLAIVLFQALLSYELARMFYLATPFLAVMVAVVFKSIFEKRESLGL